MAFGLHRLMHAFWMWLLSILLILLIFCAIGAILFSSKSNITSIKMDSENAADQARLEAIGAVETVLLAPTTDV